MKKVSKAVGTAVSFHGSVGNVMSSRYMCIYKKPTWDAISSHSTGRHSTLGIIVPSHRNKTVSSLRSPASYAMVIGGPRSEAKKRKRVPHPKWRGEVRRAHAGASE